MPARTDSSPNGGAPVSSKRFELPLLNFKFASLTEGTDIPPPLPSPVEEEPPENKLKETKETKEAEEKKETPVQKKSEEKPSEKPEEKSEETEADKTKNKPNGEEALSNGVASSSKMNGTLAENANVSSTSHTTSPQTTGGLKRPAADYPPSPTLSSRPGSIRRLFSRRRLNTTYTNAEAEGQQGNANGLDAASIIRPESRSGTSFMDDRKSRRTSGWFRRLRGGTSTSTASSNGSIYGDASSQRWKRSTVAIYEEQPKKELPKKPTGPPPPMIPELAELEAKVGLSDGGSLGNDLFKNIK